MNVPNGPTASTSDLTYQLVLTDETLRVLLLLLPEGPVAHEIHQARDLMNAGHLTVAQVGEVAEALERSSDLATADAVKAAHAEIRERLARFDLEALTAALRRVSVFRVDPERDEPRRAIDDHDA